MLNIGIIGAGEAADWQQAALVAVPGVAVVGQLDTVPDFAAVAEGATAGVAELEDLLRASDAVFISVPTAAHYQVAQAAARQGVHLFIAWPPATSIRECEGIMRLAEEAGVEAGVSRPLRYHPALQAWPAGRRPRLITVHLQVVRGTAPRWSHILADALDLCCTLAQSHSVQRVDAEAVRGSDTWPDAVAFGLRFHSGTYAQVTIRRTATSAAHLYVGGRHALDADLRTLAYTFDGTTHASSIGDNVPAVLAQRETRSFVEALQHGQPAPVSILDGLGTLRVLESLMQRLR